MVTPQEAKERCIPWRVAPPEPQVCQFCGQPIQPQGIVLQNMVFLWRPNVRCTCEKAVAYWQEYDRKQAEKKARKEDEERRRAMQSRIDRLLGNSGIKKRFQQRTFPNFRTDTPGRQKNYRVAKEYADNFAYHKAKGDGLYIEGTNGTGKTHLAAAIALQLIGEGIPVICKTSSDLLLDVKKAFDNEGVKDGGTMHPEGCVACGGKCSHKYCDKFKWVIDRAKAYGEATGLNWEDVLDGWETDRNYWYMNYYQDCN